MHKIMFSAGEVSGDMHGANLAAALKKMEPGIKMFGLGGAMMRREGVDLVADMAQYSVMGFYEVLLNVGRLLKLRSKMIRFMKTEKPDILVLIDYPDFNWRLAPAARKLNIPVFSYIPPSAWAWRKGRAKNVAKIANKIAAIFPFETDAYEAAGADIQFVGNPLLDTVKAAMNSSEAYEYFSLDSKKIHILLLPGSRKQEIEMILPVMLQAACLFKEKHSETEFHIAVAQGIDEEHLRDMAGKYGLILKFHRDRLYDLMGNCDVAFATSGTVVLEAAMMGLPSVVLYRMSKLTYCIAKLFVDVEFFSLPNILAQKKIIPELLQDNVTPENIVIAADSIMQNGREKNEAVLKSIKRKLGIPGVADRTAGLIIETADKFSSAGSVCQNE
ncbi:lipid-A-disaccharide synthase [Pectinatus haikarae]|nr:lipid-A-disaccharide synthase [Pectinatus haikarae]